MARRQDDVDAHLRELQHPLKRGVELLRAAILASDAGITEHVNWNAPSFCHDGVDRVTFRDLADVEARRDEVVDLVERWVAT